MYELLLQNFSYYRLIYLQALNHMTKDLDGLSCLLIFAFLIRVNNIKYLHDQLGLILHTGAFVNMTEVRLHRVVPYLQALGYPFTIDTVK